MSCNNSKFNTYFESFAPFNNDNDNNIVQSNQTNSPKYVKVDDAYYTDIPTQGGNSESLNQAIFKRTFSKNNFQMY